VLVLSSPESRACPKAEKGQVSTILESIRGRGGREGRKDVRMQEEEADAIKET